MSRKFVWSAHASGFLLQLAAKAPTGRWHLLFDLTEDFLPERPVLKLRGMDTPLRPIRLPTFRSTTVRYLYVVPTVANSLKDQICACPLRYAISALPGDQFAPVTEPELTQDLDCDDSVMSVEGEETISPESQWPAERLLWLRGLFDDTQTSAADSVENFKVRLVHEPRYHSDENFLKLN